LYRRVDPAGRTIGEFLREEVSGPLDAGVVIGVREEEMSRVLKVRLLGFGYQLLQSLIPRFLGRRIVHNFFQIFRRLVRVTPSMVKSGRTGAPPPFTGSTLPGYFNDPGFAFVPTSLHGLNFLNERGKRYQAEVLRCVAKRAEKTHSLSAVARPASDPD
jgi:hypothetical protein